MEMDIRPKCRRLPYWSYCVRSKLKDLSLFEIICIWTQFLSTPDVIFDIFTFFLNILVPVFDFFFVLRPASNDEDRDSDFF